MEAYYFVQPLMGALIYGFPSKEMTIIGVTGTNGKSTVIRMLFEILKEKDKTAYFSSIESRIGDQAWENNLRMTMPGRLSLQKFLKKCLEAQCRYVILEVTSEGIKQYRHKFIDFNIAVFTNLSPEHIESHGSFENYRAAKQELFKATKNVHILNLEDKNIDYFDFPANKKYYYGKKYSGKDEEIIAQNIVSNQKGSRFTIEGVEFEIPLLGSFNIDNALAAICVGLSQNINLELSSQALKNVKGIPGRMEVIINEPFQVIVDYAFTPNALERVYNNIKENFQPNNLICVLGSCGGGRDKWKRPVLGEIAKNNCQKIIVTNEDPYDEDPETIINQVLEGVGARGKKIIDRREAIYQALQEAKKGDVVVITGKGSEPSICFKNNRKEPWDDRKIVKEEFNKLNN